MRIRDAIRAAVMVLSVVPKTASGGPPFKTDDPQPVDFRHWEFYLASVQQYERDAANATCPHVEVNYGVIPNMQLHLVAPLAYVREEGKAHYGFADAELGVKYRFSDETESLPQAGVFPLVEIPTGSESRGLGSGAVQVYLPLWLQKSWGKFTTYAGAGWWYNPGTGHKNWLYTGWEAQYDFSELLTLGGELYYQTPDMEGATSSGGFNVGGFLNITDNHHVLFSVGHTFSGGATTTAYVGYQLTI